ncbi:MAG: response regulator [Deltaproteobacteria bacterium]|nr:response regulator [Deltaproteobacteria bacterium]
MDIFNLSKIKEKQASNSDEKKHSILIVDDEAANLRALNRVLSGKYNIFEASNGKEALEFIQMLKNPGIIDVVITDQRMPYLTGIDFLNQTYHIIPKAIRIILTAYTDIDSVIKAINDGRIYKFIQKPYDPNDLFITVQRALQASEAEIKLIKRSAEILEIQKKLKNEVKEFFIKDLSAEEKTWLVDAVKGIVLCKEQMNKNELGYLRTILSFLYDKNEAKRLIDMVKEGDKSGLSRLKTEADKAFDMATVLMNIAIADGIITNTEEDFYKYALKKLGYEMGFANKMLEWGKNKILSINDLKQIKKSSYGKWKH